MMSPATKKVKVELIGKDGNVFAILAAVSKALKKAGFTKEADEYMNAARKCESYDEVLQLTTQTVDVE